MIIFLKSSLNMRILSPNQPLGIFIIFIGLILTGIILYIIYAVITNKEPIEDKKIRTQKDLLQQEKIGKLFPKRK